ncbi:complement component C1q receptor [Phascolarctos cinereus]|uniref:Complement component C1q receptor n=1 Tax=Phascolarctos cinereus TaxID=38626 RepID=A0A6P5KAX7_PHACI|nr:complement component C1q receptor [Phascolarctos cinereus]
MGTALLLLILLLLAQMLLSPKSWAGASNEEEEEGEAAAVCAGTACYTAHWGKLSAAEAQFGCSTNGGNLATVKSEEEAQHIQEALAQLPERETPARMVKFWIGLQREKGKCMDPDDPLKGFSWVGSGENTSYSNWNKDPMSTCIFKRCASLLVDLSSSSLAAAHLVPKWSESPCGTSGSPGRNIEGYVCKFSFKGMCHPVALGGPGEVTYTTPFGATSTSLAAVPFASAANVNCGYGSEKRSHYLVCKERSPKLFDWGTPGPFCASPNHGCAFNNGGCQQECLEGGDGSFLCGCRPGYRLLDDLVSCIPRDPCHPNPCRGKAKCSPGGPGQHYECQCPAGFKPTPNRLDCDDVDECSRSPCAHNCVNTPGSFHCTCHPGYEPHGHNGMECWDVDECAGEGSPCAQLCINTEGSFQCACQKGYKTAGEDGTQCQDVDECAEAGNPCESLCYNGPGSFLCGCPPGWTLAPNGISCIASHTVSGLPDGTHQEKDEKEGKKMDEMENEKEEKEKEKENTGSSPSVLDTSKKPEVTLGASVPYNVAPTMGGPSQQTNPPITPEPSRPPVLSRKPRIQEISDIIHPTVIATDGGSQKGESLANGSDDDNDDQKLLLFYILGTVAAILLLLAMALGLVFYRKKKAKRAEKKKSPQNAADCYSWVPEQAETRAVENEHR